MASNDPSEWRLYNTAVNTQLAILPVVNSHLYFEINEPGSGELRIPLDSTIAASITEGMFCMLYYRGAARGGFFVENIKIIDADASEGSGRMLSVSGRGALTLLEEVIVYNDTANETTRVFTAAHKVDVLQTLINERYDRGTWLLFDYDFGGGYDSDSIAQTDSEDLSFAVGTTLLEVLRQFAKSGELEFSVEIQAGAYPFLLRAFSTPLGTDKSETIFMRIGSNCEEVTRDTRGGTELKNATLVKYKDGYTSVSDSTSITAYRRREGFLNLDVAQSGDSAVTYASAKLAQTKDPTNSISIRVYDGISPRLFVDYVMGDTVTLDRFGTETSYRILGIQADFDESGFSHVVLETNALLYDNDLKMQNDLDWLLTQWGTARDANQLEVKQWMSIGSPNGEVYALHTYGDYLYVGGNFTQITGFITCAYIARYQISTGTWSSMGTTIPDKVLNITDIAGTIYCTTNDKIYSWGGSSWTLKGTANVTGTGIKTAVSDGTSLYIGGGITATGVDGVAMSGKVAKLTGSTWTDPGNAVTSENHSLVFYNGVLYGGWNSAATSNLKYLSGSTWTSRFTRTERITGLCQVGDNLMWIEGTGATVYLYSWDGVAGSPTLAGTITGHVDDDPYSKNAIAAYLSDAFIGSEFTTVDGVAGYNHIAKYSGGSWSKLGTGFSLAAPAGNDDRLNTVCVVGDDLYAGGLFTTAGDKPIINLAVWVTDFQSLIDHLDRDGGFDLGSAIHDATAAAITDSGEIPFWDSVTSLLRKITWANIKATLKTYFDTLYYTGSDESVQDLVGAMVSGNTETGIAVTYDDTNGKLDFDARTAGDARYALIANGLVPYTSTNNIYRTGNPSANSTFTALINGAPTNVANSVVTFDTISAGNATVITPSAAGQLAQMRLYNNTRGNYALVVSVSGSTVTVDRNVTTLGAPWLDNDSISTLATGATIGAGSGGINYAELEVIDATLMGKSALLVEMTQRSSVANESVAIHPYTAYVASKAQYATCPVANIPAFRLALIPLTSNVLGIWWNGTNNTETSFKVTGYQP